MEETRPPTSCPNDSHDNENTETTHDMASSGVDKRARLKENLALPSAGQSTNTVHASDSEKDAREAEGEDEAIQLAILSPEKSARRREKQREKRRLKRASKRSTGDASEDNGLGDEPENSEQAASGDKRNRQRPSPQQRTALFLKKIDQCSQLFLKRMPRPKVNGPLDAKTADTTSRVVTANWTGEGRKRTFRSTQDLQRFTDAKASELAYLKKMLDSVSEFRTLGPTNHDRRSHESFMAALGQLFDAWGAGEHDETTKQDVLQEAPRLFNEVVIPNLETQLVSLRRKVVAAGKAEDRHEVLQAKLLEQRRLKDEIRSLIDGRDFILPICPIWHDIGQEIQNQRKKQMNWDDLEVLERQTEEALTEYERLLEWI